MKKRLFIALLCFLFLGGAAIGKDLGKGWIYYAYIEVSWDGISDQGNWYVFAPDGTPLTGCDDCLDMEYAFKCVGKTLQFDETYVEVVPAFPQTHHVVLHDTDGGGTYTGAITARYEWPLGTRRMDIIEYEVTVDENCEVMEFLYKEHEYKQKNDVESNMQ
jgi:hypothetical protein